MWVGGGEERGREGTFVRFTLAADSCVCIPTTEFLYPRIQLRSQAAAAERLDGTQQGRPCPAATLAQQGPLTIHKRAVDKPADVLSRLPQLQGEGSQAWEGATLVKHEMCTDAP